LLGLDFFTGLYKYLNDRNVFEIADVRYFYFDGLAHVLSVNVLIIVPSPLRERRVFR
jgi:hypothetical protein